MFNQADKDVESSNKSNDDQTNQEFLQKQELEKVKQKKYFTLMQVGMNGINFEQMYNQCVNNKISEIMGEVGVDGIKQ